jgi:hypothetical protein
MWKKDARFEPSDVVPLANYAYPKSIGNTKSITKVVAERGWKLEPPKVQSYQCPSRCK